MPVMQNVAYALRTLRKSLGFNFLVVAILAVGIGANVAIFTLLNAALLKPLPYRSPSALAFVSAIDRGEGDTNGCLSYPHFQLIASRSRAFTSLAAFTNENFNFTNGSDAIQLEAARVSWNFFDILGIKPTVGRSFLSAEGKPGGALVAVISDQFWRRQLNSDAHVAGKTIALDSTSYTVVGVLPPSFQFGLLGTAVDVWTTHIDELNLMTAQQLQAGACYLDVVARLAPGVSISQAQAEMRVLDQQYVHEYAKLADADPKRPIEVVPLNTKLVGSFRSVFLMLATAVAFVLLIACANVAGLLLTRALGRRREIAVRIALGASRKQLVMQLLTESIFLALLSGALGLALSVGGTRLLVHLSAKTFPRATELAAGVDWNVLAFALAVSIATGVLFGLVPALQFSKPNVSASLREEGRGTAGARSRNFGRNSLVAGQVALSFVLLAGAGLLIRSFILLATQPPGFEPRNVLTMNVALSPSRYSTPEQMIEFYDEAVHRIESLPGVKAAAAASALPINVSRLTPVLIEGQPAVPLAERPILIIQMFTPWYLRAMQIPLLEGRFFNDYDRRDSSRVVVVNRSFAMKFFRGQDPVGKHILLGRVPTPSQIVGVIGDIKNVSLTSEAQPEIDVPFPQAPWARMNLIVRSSVDPRSLTGAIRQRIAQIDRNQPVTAVETLDELLSDAGSQPRLIMMLLTAFALFAFTLAIVGLYGVISYSVVQRTEEMGVRIALGATRIDLLWLVLRQGALLAILGILLGVASSLVLTRLMADVVYGISTIDPLTFSVVAIAFFAFALLASYIPARRVTHVDVMDVLRG